MYIKSTGYCEACYVMSGGEPGSFGYFQNLSALCCRAESGLDSDRFSYGLARSSYFLPSLA